MGGKERVFQRAAGAHTTKNLPLRLPLSLQTLHSVRYLLQSQLRQVTTRERRHVRETDRLKRFASLERLEILQGKESGEFHTSEMHTLEKGSVANALEQRQVHKGN